jgi:hypothetical protein
VITDPAVLIHPDQPSEADIAVPASSAAVAAAAATSAAEGHSEVLRHPVVQMDSFLTGSEVAWLMDLVFDTDAGINETHKRQ